MAKLKKSSLGYLGSPNVVPPPGLIKICCEMLAMFEGVAEVCGNHIKQIRPSQTTLLLLLVVVVVVVVAAVVVVVVAAAAAAASAMAVAVAVLVVGVKTWKDFGFDVSPLTSIRHVANPIQ